jgi:hypothetical protein
VTALANNTQLQKLYRPARALKAAPQLAAEAAGEHAVASVLTEPPAFSCRNRQLAPLSTDDVEKVG